MLETPSTEPKLATRIFLDVLSGIKLISEENKVIAFANMQKVLQDALDSKDVKGNAEVAGLFQELKVVLETNDLNRLKEFANTHLEAAMALS